MKNKHLILLIVLSVFFVSCGKETKSANETNENVNASEIAKMCEEKNVECDSINVKYNGKNSSIFCGKCHDGYECRNHHCFDIDECSDPTLNDCNENTNCANEEGTYSCICNENYSGEDCIPDARIKECIDLPENAEWNSVSEITQTWNGTSWQPSNKGSFNEKASATECQFKCKENYSWTNSKCVAETRETDCKAKPGNSVWNDNNANGKFTQTWNGSEWIPEIETAFSKTPGTCIFICGEGFYYNENQCEIAPTQNADCTDLPQNAEWNTAETIIQTWDGEEWIPTNIGSYNELASAGECRFKCKKNYSWDKSAFTCDADTKTANCTGLPKNAEWNTVSNIIQTWNGEEWEPDIVGVYNKTASSTECYFKCKDNYSLDELTSKCEADTRDSSCSSKPANTIWNDNGANGKFTQTWDGDEWVPANYESIYSENIGVCAFKCEPDYHKENNLCLSNTKTNVACTELPPNAQWNTTSSITQTWNGSSYQPTTSGVYNTDPSTEYCRYQCKTNYNWKSSTSTCEAATQYANCSDKPENTVWNDNGEGGRFIQTWDGEKWSPTSYISTYNTTAGICNFKCDDSNFWDNSECMNPCDYEPCEEIANSTKVCAASAWNQYACGCNNGYYWWGTKKGCVTKRVYLSDLCTGQKKCYNNSSSITCPTSTSADFYGQDPQYRSSCTDQSFMVKTISGEKVVEDLGTGLMWQQTISRSQYIWLDAYYYCNNLNYAGYTDWRLPENQELLTIVDNGRYNPAINTTYFPNTPNKGTFWADRYYYNNEFTWWYMYFYDGSLKTTSETNAHYVRCVRGEHLHNPIFDETTGSLIFALSYYPDNLSYNYPEGGLYVSEITWQEALEYCEHLTANGFSDRHLPTKNELAYLINYNKRKPSSDYPELPPTWEYQLFWSSTTGTPGTAWVVDFHTGRVFLADKTGDYSAYYAGCIRRQ